MRLNKLLITAVFIFILTAPALAQDIDFSPLECGGDKVCVYVFWGKGCPHCAKIKGFLQEEYGSYKDIEIKELEVYFNRNNQKLFQFVGASYSCEIGGVPTVFVGDEYFVGADEEAQSGIKKKVMECLKEGCRTPFELNEEYQAGLEQTCGHNEDEKGLTLPAIITAAAVDSINPCAFSVIIFLLVYLMSLGARKRILKVGLAYISVVFMVYFLAGLGLLSFIQSAEITSIIFDAAAGIAIIAGLINVKDFFFYGRGISLSIPKSKRKTIEKYVKKTSVPAAAVLGFLVSMYELPCTGGVYLAILSLLADKMTRAAAVPYLFIYNLVFVLPLIAILLLVYQGMSPEKLEKWRKEKRRHMKLASGLLMLALGAGMILGWF